VEDLKDAQDALTLQEIVSNQVEYNLGNRDAEAELIPYCKAQKITIVAYSPLGRGQVSRRKDEILDKIAAKHQKTRAQIALNFLTREENVVAIPKADRLEHVKENCEASGWRLSEEEIRLIDERFR
jgi:diketogulonate reductase-like aldo/keto reductase